MQLLTELADVADNGITADELARAKQQKVADFVYGRQSVEMQAQMLANDFMSANDVDFSRLYTDRIGEVTAAQVQAVAQKYLTPKAMAVTRMVPQSSPQAPQGKVQSTSAGQTTKLVLPNGLTVILGYVPSVDLVSMNLCTLGGVLAEDKSNNGIGQTMAELSLKGAGDRTAEDIAAFFDRSGGQISAQCANNTWMWEATVLKDQAQEAAEILADVVIKPTFPAEELSTLRPSLLASIAHIDEQWNQQMQRFFRSKFYTNSPYQMLPTGSAEVIKKLKSDDVAAFHRQWIKAGTTVLSIYGNFDLAAMQRVVEQYFAKMPEGKPVIEIPPPRKVIGEASCMSCRRGISRRRSCSAGRACASPRPTTMTPSIWSIQSFPVTNCPPAGCTKNCAAVNWCMWWGRTTGRAGRRERFSSTPRRSRIRPRRFSRQSGGS